jgi:hypothetical protein
MITLVAILNSSLFFPNNATLASRY